MSFQKATKKQSRVRLALIGPSGSGKTYTALTLAGALGKKTALIDTERGSASKYADLFDFEVCDLETFSPENYIRTIVEAGQGGYDTLVIDSLSHAWMGKGGALEMVDQEAKRSKSNNTFTAWREVTPWHNRLVDTILQCPCHVIVTMRAKTEYAMETVNGKSVPRKVGLAPIQRDGMEYEFDVVADMDLDLNFIVSKTRCSALVGAIVNKPTADLGKTLLAWVSEGVKAVAPTTQKAGPSPSATFTTRATEADNRRLHAKANRVFGEDVEAYRQLKVDVIGENIKTTELTTNQVAMLDGALDSKIAEQQAGALVGA